MAPRGKGGKAGKGGKKNDAAKAGRAPFRAPTNTKTGESGAAALKGAAAAEKVKPSEVRKLIPEKALNDLLRVSRGLKKNMDEINGELREKIAYAKEHKNLNTKAFGWLRQLDRMENEKLAAFLDDLEAYMDMAGIAKRRESVGKLPLGEAEEDDDAEAGDGEAAEAAADKAHTNGTGEAQQASGQAPGGQVVMLQDRKAAGSA